MSLDRRLRRAAQEAEGLFDSKPIPPLPERRAWGPLVAVASGLSVLATFGVVALLVAVASGLIVLATFGVVALLVGGEDSSPAATTSPPASSVPPTTVVEDDTSVEPLRLDDGMSLVPLEMDDGTRIAILLPAGMVPGSVQVDAGSDSAELEGPDFDAVLAYEFCPGDVQDAGSLNGNGALVAVLADRLVICRPDQMLRLDIETSEPSDHSSESFDIVPMDLGESYLATIEANDQAPICCDAFGPLPVDSLMITANRFTSGRITAWNSETLVPEWTTSIGESSLLLGAWEGVVVATPGRGQIFGLDAGNGQTLWQLALSQYEEVVGAGHESGDNVWYISSEFPIEGETAAPRVRSLDVETGQVLWTAQGRPETLLQWVDPAVFTDVVVMMDVPRFVPDQDIATTSHLLAYDKETGEQIWSVDLEDPTEAFSDRLLASDSSNEILIAATPSGEVFSLDPASGQILWRTETGFARITDLNNSTVRLQQGSAEIELDVNTGQPINK